MANRYDPVDSLDAAIQSEMARPTQSPLTDVLIRLVRMTFRPEEVDTFLQLFDRAASSIRGMDGCIHLELWQDVDKSDVFTTYSLWRDREALEAYRRSRVFRDTWIETKRLFRADPEVQSLTRIRP